MSIRNWLEKFRGNIQPAKHSTSSGGSAKRMAILGSDCGGGTRECFTECIACGKPVTILLPGPRIPGERAQVIMKHRCVHCGQALFALTRFNGQAALSLDCAIEGGGLRMNRWCELEVLEDAHAARGGEATRCRAEPLVVGNGPDGRPALVSPKDLGIT